MIWAIARVMTLTLLRDRGGLVMVLLLPPVIFLLFASIFSTASTGAPFLRIGLVLTHPLPELRAALQASPAQSVVDYATEADLRAALASGLLDVGLVGRAPLTLLNPAPVTLLVDNGKQMAGAVLDGRIRSLLAQTAPAVMLERQALQIARIIGPFTPDQTARQMDALAAVPPSDGDGLTEVDTLGGPGGADPAVTYYAGAIAMMFLLFSATQSATGLIDERESGILDRFAAGPGGIDVVVLGRAVFLTAQGFVQTALIFALAAVVFDVQILDHALTSTVAALLSAGAAAGFGLACAAACHSRAQAAAISTFLVLVSSALGGSMVPRFLMPDWLRDAGLVTPNAWAIELFQGLLFQALPLTDLMAPALALAALAVGGTAAAVVLSRQRMML
jgi:ABC-2 type transport system permease protein